MDKPASSGFASVVIKNASLDKIQSTTIQVFKEADYQSTYSSLNQSSMVFEKEGTRGQSFAYNGIVGTHENQMILDRVKVNVAARVDNSFTLSCQAFVVRNAGDSFSAEEIKVSSWKSGPYQKLLDEVAKRLNTPKS